MNGSEPNADSNRCAIRSDSLIFGGIQMRDDPGLQISLPLVLCAAQDRQMRGAVRLRLKYLRRLHQRIAAGPVRHSHRGAAGTDDAPDVALPGQVADSEASSVRRRPSYFERCRR